MAGLAYFANQAGRGFFGEQGGGRAACRQAGSTPTTLLTEKTAASLIRKIRKAGHPSGLQPDLAIDYIHTHAPAHYQDDYVHMWTEFLEEAQATLFSDMDYALTDALSLLRRECNIKQ